MPWWGWVSFWVFFWLVAIAYIIRKAWKIWPHARDFGHVVSRAWQQIEEARINAQETSSSAGVVARRSPEEPLPWDKPRSHWQKQYRQARAAQHDRKLDQHSEVWRHWGDPVD